jgi:hypothetical protein
VEQGQQDRLLIPFQFRSSDGDLFTMRVFHMLVVRCSRRLNRSSDVLVVQMKRLRKGEATLDSARCGPLGSAEREVPFDASIPAGQRANFGSRRDPQTDILELVTSSYCCYYYPTPMSKEVMFPGREVSNVARLPKLPQGPLHSSVLRHE